MGNIFSSFTCKIHPENNYKINNFDNFSKKISDRKIKLQKADKTIKKTKSISSLESMCLLPMSRHGSMRNSRSLDFLNLM